MTYLVFSAGYFVVFGWRPFILCMDLNELDVSTQKTIVHDYLLMYIHNSGLIISLERYLLLQLYWLFVWD